MLSSTGLASAEGEADSLALGVLLEAGAELSLALSLLLLPPQAVSTTIKAIVRMPKPLNRNRFIVFFSPFANGQSYGLTFNACSCNPLDEMFLREEEYDR